MGKNLVLALCLLFSKNVFSQDHSLVVQTINVCQYPAPFGWRDIFLRTKELASVILHKERKPDVLFIQEAWSNASKKGIILLFKKSYPFYVYDETYGKYGMGANSGLMILSRFPLSEKAQHFYTMTKGEDNLARKGVLGATVIFNEIPISLFTTHLQAGGDYPLTEKLDRNKPSTDEIRRMQLREINSFVKNYNPENQAAIIGGDFNIDWHTEGNDFHENLPIFKNSFDPLASLIQGSAWHDGHVSEGLIDHIFYTDGFFKQASSVVSDEISYNITDHLTVVGEFIFTPNNR